ncbi:MAG: aldo/keto reductase [Verrucomicrobiae bacterium]|nr:aldo/keto reductase [Verrucomicrobiae bacterium]
MKTRPLGQTGLTVSEIGFGTWGLGGTVGGSIAYGPADDRESLRALHHAFDAGITFYDTADLYGAGHSERLLGEAFSGSRNRVVIATKAGIVSVRGEQDFSPAHLRGALTASLERLRSDYADVFLLHDPPIELLDQQPDIIRLLENLQRAGRIRAWGVSVRSPDEALVAVTRFGAPVIEVNFNLADQRARQNGLLELCDRQQVGCIIRTPLCFGFLTGQYAADTPFDPADHRRRWPAEQRQRWAEAGKAFSAAITPLAGQTAAQLALRFCLSYPGVSTAIPGMLTAAHVDDNAGASRLGPLPAEERQRLEELYEQHRFFLGDGR